MADTNRNPPFDEDVTIPVRRPAPDGLEAGGPPDYDSDPKGGGGEFPEHGERAAPDGGADAPVHGSR